MNKLEKNPVLVFYTKERLDVDAKAFETFKINYANFKLIKISEQAYQSCKEVQIDEKDEIAEATHVYHQAEGDDKLFEQCESTAFNFSLI